MNEVPIEFENYWAGLEVTPIIIAMPPKESIFLTHDIKGSQGQVPCIYQPI